MQKIFTHETQIKGVTQTVEDLVHDGNTIFICGPNVRNDNAIFRSKKTGQPTPGAVSATNYADGYVDFEWLCEPLDLSDAWDKKASIVFEGLSCSVIITNIEFVFTYKGDIYGREFDEVLNPLYEHSDVDDIVNQLNRSMRVNIQDVMVRKESECITGVTLSVAQSNCLSTNAKMNRLSSFFITTAKNYLDQEHYFKYWEAYRERVKTNAFG